MQVMIGNRFRCVLFATFCVLLLCCSAGLSAIIAEAVTLVPLTDDGKSRAVAWAWHGDWVAFARQVGDSSQWQLHVMKSDGTEARPACQAGDLFFAEWSWAGDRIVYEFSNATEDESQGRITPTLLADGRISMAVSIKVGSFTFTPDAGLPEQVYRESTTTVIVREGQALVIGGLRQQEMSEAVIKVPILGDIPIIVLLFKKTQKATRNSVLTLFITPHVLLPDVPVPDWPHIDADDHKIKPIMKEAPSQNGKSSKD